MRITITEFAEQRGEDRGTVNAYIRKHPEIQKFVTKDKKNTVIDTESEGYELLDKQYPLPKPVEIIEDKESREKLLKAQELIIQLQERLNAAQSRISQAEATQKLLESKEQELNREIERSERVESLNSELRAEIKELQQELETERRKTWIDKLFKK